VGFRESLRVNNADCVLASHVRHKITGSIGQGHGGVFACASDQRFNAPRLMAEMKAIGAKYDFINRLIMRYYAIPFMRERLLMLKGHFRFLDWEPDQGPGRTDTFNPAKTLLEFPLEQLQTRELVGLCDFPSIWLQGQRKEHQLHAHWDGNNSMMEERNKSAAFGTGTFPPTIDLKQVARIEEWLLTKEPPKYPFVVNAQLSAQGEKLYAQYCASCHGRNGRDLTGVYVGNIVPIEQIGTDRHRLDSYTEDLATAQNALFAGSDGGARSWAIIASLIQTAKLNQVEPFAYLRDVLQQLVAGYTVNRLDELLPWNWKPAPAVIAA